MAAGKYHMTCIKIPMELYEKIKRFNESSDVQINVNKTCVSALQDVIKECGA